MTDAHTQNDDISQDSDVIYDEDSGDALIKKLREKIRTLEAEKQEYLDGWQRMKADVVNRDRAAAEERTRIAGIVKEGILEELLPILDAFDAAFSGSAWEKVDTNWRVGIEYIHSQFKKVLDENNIKEFGSLADAVDPTKHDIVEEIEAEGGAGRLIKILRKGYELQGRVIRPARVVVSK
jgi:molecular chaperone GrpE